MKILGISCFYHDAAASLIIDGQVIAAVEEERFVRIKHYSGFPMNAIKYCLKVSNVRINDLDYIAFYEKPLLKFMRIIESLMDNFPYSYPLYKEALPVWLGEKLKIQQIIREKLDYKKKIIFVEHHLAHAASCFYPSGFEKAAILTCDGVGEYTTTSLAVGSNRDIKVITEIKFPHSLGLLYNTITAFLGFRVNNGEGKVMGLAGYGQPQYYEEFRELIDFRDDGSFQLNMKYFDFCKKIRMYNSRIEKLLGPSRRRDAPLEKRHQNIAASLQYIVEEILIKMANYLYEITGIENLCMAGGVALNSLANGKIFKNTPFRNIFIQPAASDAGASLGAALYLYHSILQKPRGYVMRNAYLGPDYQKKEIKEALIESNLNFRELEEQELLQEVVNFLRKDKIVGWFQGRIEFGPRALGARSILANPVNPEMKNILNLKVKHRESFRPYAPSVLEEDCKEFFNLETEAPFMLLVAEVRKDKKDLIPAVVHVDGSARIQTVKAEDNGIYYHLIKRFKEATGVPILLNTSFNVRGEPIVCSPQEAINTFLKTEMDCLILENFLVSK